MADCGGAWSHQPQLARVAERALSAEPAAVVAVEGADAPGPAEGDGLSPQPGAAGALALAEEVHAEDAADRDDDKRTTANDDKR